MKSPQDCTSIEDVREGIDTIDKQIIELIAHRFEYVKEIVRFKKNEEDVLAKTRYDQVFEVRRQWAEKNHLNPEIIESIYKILVHYFIDEQMKMIKK